MSKKSLTILILAALTILLFAGCGNDTEMESSTPEALATFGVNVDPSAMPSAGQTISSEKPGATVKDPVGTGTVGEGNTETVGNSGTPSTSSPTSKPSGGSPSTAAPKPSTPTSPSPSSDPTDPPIISPPQPASNASADEAREYIGKTRDELYDALGLPTSSDYALIDEADPDAGEIGTLYFKGFTVTTKKTADEEIITAVNEDSTPVDSEPEE